MGGLIHCTCAVLQDQREAQAVPAVLAEEQWEALGRRLRGIESSLQVHAAPTGAS